MERGPEAPLSATSEAPPESGPQPEGPPRLSPGPGGLLPSGGTGDGSGRRPARASWSALRFLVGLVALAVVLSLVLRAPRAAHEVTTAFGRVRGERAWWLLVAGGLETASLACNAKVQQRLLSVGGYRLPTPTLLGLTVASTAVVDLLPAGVAPANGWLVEQYRRRGVAVPLAIWTVLAAGFTATVSGLALVLVGAGLAGIWSPAGLVACGAFLVAGSAGFVAAAHRLGRIEPSLSRRAHRPIVARAAGALERVASYRISPVGGASVLVLNTLNWLLDAGCLVVAFILIDRPVPWAALLFAYAGSQMLAGVVFVRLGVVEGGLVGGFVLAGTPSGSALAAILVYRAVSYWLVAGVGTGLFVTLTRAERRDPPPGADGAR